MKRKRLKLFRIERDLTQSDMALHLGCERATYSAIELGKRNPSFDLMERFKKVFNVPAESMWALWERER